MNVALAGVERIVKEEAERGWDVRCLVKARKRVNYGVVSWLAGMMATQGHGESSGSGFSRRMLMGKDRKPWRLRCEACPRGLTTTSASASLPFGKF